MKTNVITFAMALGFSTCLLSAQDNTNRPGSQPPPGNEAGPTAENVSPRRDAQRPVMPLIAALDLNKDGIIDAEETAKASESLKKLDRNEDGKLTILEYRGQPPFGAPAFARQDREDQPNTRPNRSADDRMGNRRNTLQEPEEFAAQGEPQERFAGRDRQEGEDRPLAESFRGQRRAHNDREMFSGPQTRRDDNRFARGSQSERPERFMMRRHLQAREQAPACMCRPDGMPGCPCASHAAPAGPEGRSNAPFHSEGFAGPVAPGMQDGFHLLPPPVQKHLGLTEKQHHKLAKLESGTKKKVEKLLTPEQRIELRHMHPGLNAPKAEK